MKPHLIRLLLLTSFLLVKFSLYAQNDVSANAVDTLLANSVNEFVDEWHKQAANADIAYFDKIADNGVYIGTDATENWKKDEFVTWSKQYFDRGKAWSFVATERNIYFSDDSRYVWFDELLDTQMGVCRASGVLKRKGNTWKIEHYHLSITIPNEKMKEVIEVVDGE